MMKAVLMGVVAIGSIVAARWLVIITSLVSLLVASKAQKASAHRTALSIEILSEQALLAPDGGSMTFDLSTVCDRTWTIVQASVSVTQPQASGTGSFTPNCGRIPYVVRVMVPALSGTFQTGSANATAVLVVRPGGAGGRRGRADRRHGDLPDERRGTGRVRQDLRRRGGGHGHLRAHALRHAAPHRLGPGGVVGGPVPGGKRRGLGLRLGQRGRRRVPRRRPQDDPDRSGLSGSHPPASPRPSGRRAIGAPPCLLDAVGGGHPGCPALGGAGARSDSGTHPGPVACCGPSAGVQERRDPRLAARGRGLVSTSQPTTLLLARPGRPRGVDPPPINAASAPSSRDAGDIAALASGPDQTPRDVPAPRARSALDGASAASPDPADGSGEPDVGLPAHPR